jgi:hypothetical protein
MGFTIGGTRRRGRTTECTEMAEYTGLWGWDVVPGARTSGGRCTCGAGSCASPGPHPLAPCQEVPAGSTLDDVTKAWSDVPGAAVLLPVGRTFDVIDVARVAGGHALVRLERMGLPLGPVLATASGRAHFFVAPGAAAELPELLYRMGWDDADLDLRGLGPGTHVAVPPSELVRWLRPPSLGTARPPQARLLLGTLAYIAHRSAAA